MSSFFDWINQRLKALKSTDRSFVTPLAINLFNENDTHVCTIWVDEKYNTLCTHSSIPYKYYDNKRDLLKAALAYVPNGGAIYATTYTAAFDNVVIVWDESGLSRPKMEKTLKDLLGC